MRTILRALLASLVGVSIASGCVSWSEPTEVDDSPTPQCTPPSANSVDVNLLVADAFAFADNPVAARFVLGTQVLSCTTAMVPAGGDVALFLCSDLASYVTGQTLHVNGGWWG